MVERCYSENKDLTLNVGQGYTKEKTDLRNFMKVEATAFSIWKSSTWNLLCHSEPFMIQLICVDLFFKFCFHHSRPMIL